MLKDTKDLEPIAVIRICNALNGEWKTVEYTHNAKKALRSLIDKHYLVDIKLNNNNTVIMSAESAYTLDWSA